MKKHDILVHRGLLSALKASVIALFAGMMMVGGIVRAEVITSSTTVTVVGNTAQPVQIASGTTRYDIADEAVLTFTRTGTYVGQSGGVISIGAAATLIFAPTDSTGQVVFENSEVTVHGGAINMAGINSVLDVTNGIFRNNRNGALANSGVSGAIHNTQATTLIKLTNVVFDSNGSRGNTGAMRVTGTLLMTGGGFYSNWAMGDHTGALHMNGTPYISLTDVTFDSNRARTSAGAMTVGNGAALLNNVIFKNNWAGSVGGAIRSGHGASGTFVLTMTASGTTNDYLYSGNFASGVLDTILSSTTPNPQISENAPEFTSLAKGGGFYYASGVGVAEFNIANDVTLRIGVVSATNRNYDTIASATSNANIRKTGGGDLILNADNRYFSGTTIVQAGRLLLGNDEAKYGGRIIVSSGASFGGSGTVATLNADDTAATTNVMVGPGAILQVGTTEQASARLSIAGALTLDNATVSFVAYGGTQAAKLELLSIPTVIGTTVLNMQSFKSGTYSFGAAAADLYYVHSALLSVNGSVVAAGGRHSAQVVGTAADLQLALTVDKARAMKWTGSSGSQWNVSDDNWESVLNASIKKFAAGDSVEFDTALSGNAAITINATTPITDIAVSGPNTIIFNGDGGIRAVPYQVGDDAEASVMAGVGKLTKRGTGTIVFNNGENEFKGGIDIVDGGAIVFNRGEQLRTGGSAITFFQSATLQALGNAQMTNNIVVSASKTAELNIDFDTTTRLSGIVSGGDLSKTGAGLLILAGENTHAATNLHSGTLRLERGNALGNGPLAIVGNNTALEVAGGLTVPNAISMGANSLTLRHVGASLTTLSGNITGTGILTVGGHAPLMFSGSNNLAGFVATGSVSIIPASLGALGGAQSVVSIQAPATINLGYAQVQAKSLEVDGGTLTIDSFALGVPLLKLSDSLVLKNNALVKVGATIPSGGYVLANAASFNGVQDVDYILDVGTNTKYTYKLGFNNGAVNILVIKPDVNPSKDIVAAFESMSASMSAVYSRVSESFLSSMEERQKNDLGRDFWIKGMGTFAEHKKAADKIGFKTDALGILMGYDRPLARWLLAGAYAGYSNTGIRTNSQSHTDADTFNIGGYLAAVFGRFNATIDASIGSLAADTNRMEGIGTAEGAYRATVLGASAELGYALLDMNNIRIRPAVSVHFMDYRFREHSEAGAGAMYLDDFKTSLLQGMASIQTTYGFVTAWKKPGVLSLLMGFRSDVNANSPSLSGAFATDLTNKFHIQPDSYMGKAAVIGLGLNFAILKKGNLGLNYDYEVSKTYTRNTVTINLFWSW